MTTDTERFDAMAADYDVLEPWYEHLYARLHAILARALRPPSDGRRRRALDAGCGHGFQTALLARLGYETHGVDLAGALLALARARVSGAAFARADVTALPYPGASFDVVSCCGSTLSFVDDTDAALAEMARVLRPGGRLLVEYEHKWSLDLAWTRTLARALRGPARAPLVIDYPGYGRLTLFSRRDVRERLAHVGLRVERAWGIHALTNLLPSTVLHRPRLPAALAPVYRALRALDTAWAPGALANSVVVLATTRRADATERRADATERHRDTATSAPPRAAER